MRPSLFLVDANEPLLKAKYIVSYITAFEAASLQESPLGMSRAKRDSNILKTIFVMLVFSVFSLSLFLYLLIFSFRKKKRPSPETHHP
jgi:hypothetical protein